MKPLLDEWEKWFRTQGSVRNLYRKQSKRFRTKGSVSNLFIKKSKRFRKKGSVRNLSKNDVQKVSYKWFRTKPSKMYLSNEAALENDNSLSS